MKYSSLSSYMLKPLSFITQVFKDNKKAQEKIFKNMCDFGAISDWRNGRRPASYYLGVDNSKYQDHLFNPTPFNCIVDYIMEDGVGDMYLKNPPQQRLELIDGPISSY